MVSTLVLAENFGYLLAYIIGNYFDFYAIPKFGILITAIFAILLVFFPESPLILVKQNKMAVSKVYLLKIFIIDLISFTYS